MKKEENNTEGEKEENINVTKREKTKNEFLVRENEVARDKRNDDWRKKMFC